MGAYEHMGMHEVLSLVYFDERDYRSWKTIELSISMLKVLSLPTPGPVWGEATTTSKCKTGLSVSFVSGSAAGHLRMAVMEAANGRVRAAPMRIERKGQAA